MESFQTNKQPAAAVVPDTKQTMDEKGDGVDKAHRVVLHFEIQRGGMTSDGGAWRCWAQGFVRLTWALSVLGWLVKRFPSTH